MWHFCYSWRGTINVILPSTSNMTSWINVPSESRLPWALCRCSGWAWAGLGHPQGGDREARAETTDHFALSPTKRSIQNEVDLTGQHARAGSGGPQVSVCSCRKVVTSTMQRRAQVHARGSGQQHPSMTLAAKCHVVAGTAHASTCVLHCLKNLVLMHDSDLT